MQEEKMAVSCLVILIAAVIAGYLGYRTKSPKLHGGIIGTLLIYSFYGMLPMIVMWSIMDGFNSLGIWRSGGDTDIGPGLAPLLLGAPVYWISVFLGMELSKN